jgi:hypothetical protein
MPFGSRPQLVLGIYFAAFYSAQKLISGCLKTDGGKRYKTRDGGRRAALMLRTDDPLNLYPMAGQLFTLPRHWQQLAPAVLIHSVNIKNRWAVSSTPPKKRASEKQTLLLDFECAFNTKASSLYSFSFVGIWLLTDFRTNLDGHRFE